MPFHESTSEEAERIVQDHAQPLQILVTRSVQLRRVRSELGTLAGLIKNSKRKEALALLGKLMAEISP